MVEELVFPRVYAYMLRRTRFWKRAENAFERARFFTVTRKLIQSILLWVRVLLGQSLMSYGHRCPCLTCTVKIAQVGISEVVYAQGYNMDESVCNYESEVFCIWEYRCTNLFESRVPPYSSPQAYV